MPPCDIVSDLFSQSRRRINVQTGFLNAHLTINHETRFNLIQLHITSFISFGFAHFCDILLGSQVGLLLVDWEGAVADVKPSLRKQYMTAVCCCGFDGMPFGVL
jgi:hypothetical protein